MSLSRLPSPNPSFFAQPNPLTVGQTFRMMSTKHPVCNDNMNSNQTRHFLSTKYPVSSRYLIPDLPHNRLSDRVPRGSKNPLCFKLKFRFSSVREANSVSRYRLAALAGLANNHAAQVENGSLFPTLDTIERYANALGVPPGWLAYGYEGLEPFRERYPRPITEPSDPTPDPALRVFRDLTAGFPQRIRDARERSGLSMRTLSSAAGVSVQAWSNAEAGKALPRVDTCERMAVALGVAPRWLAYGEGNAPN